MIFNTPLTSHFQAPRTDDNRQRLTAAAEGTADAAMAWQGEIGVSDFDACGGELRIFRERHFRTDVLAPVVVDQLQPKSGDGTVQMHAINALAVCVTESSKLAPPLIQTGLSSSFKGP